MYPIAQVNIPKIKKAEETHIKTTENLKLYYNTFINKDNDSKHNLLTNTNSINNIESATYNIPTASITNTHYPALNMIFYPSISNDKGLQCNTNIRSHQNTILRKEISSSLFLEHTEKMGR